MEYLVFILKFILGIISLLIKISQNQLITSFFILIILAECIYQLKNTKRMKKYNLTFFLDFTQIIIFSHIILFYITKLKLLYIFTLILSIIAIFLLLYKSMKIYKQRQLR